MLQRRPAAGTQAVQGLFPGKPVALRQAYRHWRPCTTPAVRQTDRRRGFNAVTAVLATDTHPATAAGAPGSGATADRSHECDYVVIGSGIGGLCCAALLAKYGYRVTVCESHYLAGGAAHGFETRAPDGSTYHFDAGPSFFAGISGPKGSSSNPLKQVLDVIDESLDCVTYNQWTVHSPEGTFPCVCDAEAYSANIIKLGGPEALAQWKQLEALMAPLQAGAALMPAAAIRSDPGIILTAARFGPGLLRTGLMAGTLTGPFSAVVDKVVTNPWLRKFLDLECFVLSGMTAKDTICAEMAYMFMERNSGNSTIDYPMGGSRAIVDALVRGIEKHGGRVMLKAHVDHVVMEGGRAAGVQLRGSRKGGRPETIRARRGVISNASVWDTVGLLQPGAAPEAFTKDSMATPRTGSFMHLHLGIDATGLPADLNVHQLIINSWDDIEAPQNVCIVSIPSLFDPAMAPPGKAVVHAYTAGNEPWEIWENVKPGTPEYEKLKEERSQCLWEALERCIPDIRARAELVQVGSPHTHARFLRRYKGTYGPAISARKGSFPGPQTPVPGLYRCGDSCMPGIGVPAAAASGMICANTLAPIGSHLSLLGELAL